MHVKTTNGTVDTYPYNVGQLRRDNPNTSFPKRIPDEMLAEWGVYPVENKPHPDYDQRTQRIEQDAQPVMEDGKWVIGWSVVDKTAEEIQQHDDNASQSVRSQRDSLLVDSDWRVIKAQETGTPMSQAWVDYRQALRDITDHANFPWLDDADWPVKPE